MSNIDPTKPEAGQALTQDVRDNFAAAAAEIDANVAAIDVNEADIATNAAAIAALPEVATIFYGRVRSSDGLLQDDNGGTSAVRDGTGAYTITFDTPFPDTAYSVQVSIAQNNASMVAASSATANGFNVSTWTLAGAVADRTFYFTATRNIIV